MTSALRVVALFLLVVAGWVYSPSAHACTTSGDPSFGRCADQASATAFVSGVEQPTPNEECSGMNTYYTTYPVAGNLLQYTEWWGCGGQQNNVGAWAGATYPAPTCTAGQPFTGGPQDEWSTGSNDDLPANGSSICESACGYTQTQNGPPTWVLQFLRWTAQYSLVGTGVACAATNPPPANQSPPPTPLPDSDHDGIPDQVDPYPNDPGNTPPVAPPDTPPPPPPTPPTGPGGATSGDIGSLEQDLNSVGATLANKLDALENALSAIKTGADINAANTINAINGKSGGTGPAIDLTATNALLAQGNSNTSAISSTATDIDSHAKDIDTTLTNAMSTTTDQGTIPTTSPTGGTGAWAPDDASSPTLDQSGFGWSRSCPSPPTFSVFGRSFTLDTSVLCSWMSVGGALVLLLAGLFCIRILASVN